MSTDHSNVVPAGGQRMFLDGHSPPNGATGTASARSRIWNQVDLRLTWVSPSRRLTLIAFARNLFDTLGYDGVAANNGSGALGFGRVFSFTPPRTVGMETQYKF